MTDSDDLFEFGDLGDDDSLEIDLDELFGDLDALAIDVDAIEAGGSKEPVHAEIAPQPQPVAAVHQPVSAPQAAAPAPAPAPQQVAQNQVLQPVTPAQQAYAPPGPAPSADIQIGKLRLTKTNMAIAFATIITLSNVAVTMLTPSGAGGEQSNNNPEIAAANGGVEDFQYDQSMLQEKVNSLEAQLLRVGTPTKPVPSSYTEGDHPVFADVNDQFNAGLYQAGRQSLYNVLSIVDNFQTHERDAIESKASYLLADSWRLEAERLASQEPKND